MYLEVSRHLNTHRTDTRGDSPRTYDAPCWCPRRQRRPTLLRRLPLLRPGAGDRGWGLAYRVARLICRSLAEERAGVVRLEHGRGCLLRERHDAVNRVATHEPEGLYTNHRCLMLVRILPELHEDNSLQAVQPSAAAHRNDRWTRLLDLLLVELALFRELA